MIGAIRLSSSASQIARVSSNAARSQRRRLHQALPYEVAEGMGEFLSPEALKVIAVDYQKGLLDRLNEVVKDTEVENQSVVQTVISTAGDRSQTLAFNYASEALNNSFFLDHLKPPSTNESDHLGHEEALYSERQLLSRIEDSFGSLTQLKSAFSAAAMGMSGSGWVWLASNQLSNLAVVPTFGPGTILARSGEPQAVHSQYLVAGEAAKSSGPPPPEPQGPTISRWGKSHLSSQGPNSGTAGSPRSGFSVPRSEAASATTAQSPPSRSLSNSSMLSSTYGSTRNFLRYNNSRSTNLSGINYNLATSHVFPLLCISVHEHAWMTDYGVWGKEEYLQKYWSSVDWYKVTQLWNDWSRIVDRMKKN